MSALQFRISLHFEMKIKGEKLLKAFGVIHGLCQQSLWLRQDSITAVSKILSILFLKNTLSVLFKEQMSIHHKILTV